MNTRRKNKINYCEASDTIDSTSVDNESSLRPITRSRKNVSEEDCQTDKNFNLFQVSIKCQDSISDLSKFYSSSSISSLSVEKKTRKKKEKSDSLLLTNENIPDFSAIAKHSLKVVTESSNDESVPPEYYSVSDMKVSPPAQSNQVDLKTSPCDTNNEISPTINQNLFSTPVHVNRVRLELHEIQLGSPISSPPEVPNEEKNQKHIQFKSFNSSSDMFSYNTRASSNIQKTQSHYSDCHSRLDLVNSKVNPSESANSLSNSKSASIEPKSEGDVSTPRPNLSNKLETVEPPVISPSSNTPVLNLHSNDRRLAAGKYGKKSIARLTRAFRLVNWNTSRLDNSFIRNSSFWNHIKDDPKGTMINLARQKAPVPFSSVFPVTMRSSIKKIGEGLFGEVFSATVNEKTIVYKVFPIQGDQPVNGEPQKTFEEVLPEVVTSKELTQLAVNKDNRTQNFIELIDVSVTKGRFPSYLNRAWELYHEASVSENENPSFLPSTQLWLVLHYGFGGVALEDFEFSCPAEALSLILQLSLTLAVAECSLRFEHRDLHHGNILVRRMDETENLGYVLTTDNGNSIQFAVPLCFIKILVIDFTLSRIETDNHPLYFDLGQDEEMFMGENDYQFEIYRMMRRENGNDWSVFKPKTNIFWLHYISLKLQERFSDTMKASEVVQIKEFSDTVLNYNSCSDLVQKHTLFEKCKI